MKIDIPDILIQELVEANVIQRSGSIHSVESRGNQVTRLQWHFAEYVTALIAKQMQKRKMLPYTKHD